MARLERARRGAVRAHVEHVLDAVQRLLERCCDRLAITPSLAPDDGEHADLRRDVPVHRDGQLGRCDSDHDERQTTVANSGRSMK
jgi:hypothetical protein